MYAPEGLQAWEIIVASGLCALGFLAASAIVTSTFIALVMREPSPARTPVAASPPPADLTAETRQPAYAA